MTRAAATLAFLLLAAGCGSGFPMLRSPTPGRDAADWGPVRDQASRQATLYDGFVHRASASATWLNPEVREAAARRQAEWQGKGAAEIAQLEVQGRADAALGEEFLVAIYTAERRANDLDARGSIWHLELDDGETRVPASEVTALRSDATVRQLYPYVGPFDQLYRVRFRWTGSPLAGRTVVLRIGSSLGALVLDFGPAGQRPGAPQLAP
jgi:hypothetical protein